MKISDDLRQYVAANPHIGKVYFDKAGNHHFNVHEHQGKLYSRQRQAWEEIREDYEICEILTREQILEQELGELLEEEREDRKRLHPILAFNIFVNNTNFTFMAAVSTLTLTSTAPVTLNMTVTDGPGGPEIAGTLTGLTYTPADPTQDIAVVDPTVATEVDVHAVTNTGGTTVTGSGSFTSTLLGTDGKTPAFSGTVTGQLVLVNNIPVKVLNPVLTFNQ